MKTEPEDEPLSAWHLKRVSEADAPTHWVPRPKDLIALLVVGLIFTLAYVLDGGKRGSDAPSPTTTTQEGE